MSEVQGRWPPNGPLSAEEVAKLRRKLEQLDEESHLQGYDLKQWTASMRKDYSLATVSGRQVFNSYSDDELLDVLIRTMQHHGHSPNYDDVLCVYLTYIEARFGTLSEAKNRARTRMKHQRNEQKWPPDWHEKVSVEPLLAYLERREVSPTEVELRLLQGLCDEARQTGYPPELGSGTKERLNRLCGSYVKGLELMGIPSFRESSLRHMKHYWDEKRKGKNSHEKSR